MPGPGVAPVNQQGVGVGAPCLVDTLDIRGGISGLL